MLNGVPEEGDRVVVFEEPGEIVDVKPDERCYVVFDDGSEETGIEFQPEQWDGEKWVEDNPDNIVSVDDLTGLAGRQLVTEGIVTDDDLDEHAERAYEAGYQSQKRGIERGYCPYLETGNMRNSWLSGWDTADGEDPVDWWKCLTPLAKSIEDVHRIARSILEQEAWDELPILADALDDEGTRPELTVACRSNLLLQLHNAERENTRAERGYQRARRRWAEARRDLLTSWNQFRFNTDENLSDDLQNTFGLAQTRRDEAEAEVDDTRIAWNAARDEQIRLRSEWNALVHALSEL